MALRNSTRPQPFLCLDLPSTVSDRPVLGFVFHRLSQDFKVSRLNCRTGETKTGFQTDSSWSYGLTHPDFHHVRFACFGGRSLDRTNHGAEEGKGPLQHQP
jgi:hypothetical protein